MDASLRINCFPLALLYRPGYTPVLPVEARTTEKKTHLTPHGSVFPVGSTAPRVALDIHVAPPSLNSHAAPVRLWALDCRFPRNRRTATNYEQTCSVTRPFYLPPQQQVLPPRTPGLPEAAKSPSRRRLGDGARCGSSPALGSSRMEMEPPLVPDTTSAVDAEFSERRAARNSVSIRIVFLGASDLLHVFPFFTSQPRQERGFSKQTDRKTRTGWISFSALFHPTLAFRVRECY